MNETTSISLADQSQASIYQQLRSHLAELKLTAAAEALRGLLDEATASGWSTTETLARIMSVEIDQAESRKLAGRLRFANLPTEARLDTFDLDHAKGIDRSLLNELGTCRWIETATNVLLIGPARRGENALGRGPGTGCGGSRIPRLFHLRGRTGRTLVCDRLPSVRLSQGIQPSWWPVSSQKSGKNQASDFISENVIPGLAWR